MLLLLNLGNARASASICENSGTRQTAGLDEVVSSKAPLVELPVTDSPSNIQRIRQCQRCTSRTQFRGSFRGAISLKVAVETHARSQLFSQLLRPSLGFAEPEVSTEGCISRVDRRVQNRGRRSVTDCCTRTHHLHLLPRGITSPTLHTWLKHTSRKQTYHWFRSHCSASATNSFRCSSVRFVFDRLYNYHLGDRPLVELSHERQ